MATTFGRVKDLAKAELLSIIQRHIAPYRARDLADAIGVTERCADNWQKGKNAPGALYGLRLMVTFPDLTDEIADRIALDASEMAAALHEVARQNRLRIAALLGAAGPSTSP